jgi:hypothetical protein
VHAAHPSIIPHVSVNNKCRDAVCLAPSYTAHSCLQPSATCCSELLVVNILLYRQYCRHSRMKCHCCHSGQRCNANLQIKSNADPRGRAVQSEGLRPIVCWDCWFDSLWGHRCMSVVSIMCRQVEVCATGRSLVQRNSTDSDMSLCEI